MEKKHFDVVAAVIQKGKKYFCVQRTRSEYDYTSEHWEFPGGKVKAGECDHEALIREIKEEMDWDVFVGRRLARVDYDYPDFSITLTAYLCRPGDGEPTLFEHLNSRWCTAKQIPRLKLTAADRLLLPFIP